MHMAYAEAGAMLPKLAQQSIDMGLTGLEFAISICKDSGESAIANKIDLGGKIIVISMSIPVISTMLNGLLELLY